MDIASPIQASKPAGRFAIGDKVTGIYADVRVVAGASFVETRTFVREVRITGDVIFVNHTHGTAIVEFERPVRGIGVALFRVDELEAA